MLDHELLSAIATQLMSGTQIKLNDTVLPVRRTSSQRLKAVAFEMNGKKYEAIEQNPEKPSRWGELARQGHQVVQFKDAATNRFVAVSIDGKIKEYGALRRGDSTARS
jgi:hypothetical protein